ncbi:MAG: hypothetical protein ACLFPW_11865 [Spirochaetaceae bacterium]
MAPAVPSASVMVSDTTCLTLELLGSYEVVVAEEETVSPEFISENAAANEKSRPLRAGS